jgi:dTMP kinase
MEWVIHANLLNAEILRPDVTIFIDVDPQVCFERIKNNRARFDMYEKMDIMKHVRANYFKAFDALRQKENIVVVDGNRPVEKVEAAILHEVGKVVTIG